MKANPETQVKALIEALAGRVEKLEKLAAVQQAQIDRMAPVWRKPCAVVIRADESGRITMQSGR